MTDFEKMVTKLKESDYDGDRYFRVLELRNFKKQIDFCQTGFWDDYTSFQYDRDGNLIRIF